MKKYLPIVLASSAVFLFFFLLFSSVEKSSAATASHIVISEIQVAGATADDEFIELYNPTSGDVDLTGWRLTRKTAAGTQNNLVTSMSGVIPAHGFFLVTKPSTYTGSTLPDLTYSASSSAIATNNTIILYSDTGTTVVDKVGLGEGESAATDFEGATVGNPAASGSVERKANTSSTVDSMTAGADVTLGNGEDTENNSSDFIIRATSQPQNTASTKEPTSTVTPTNNPTPTVTGAITPTVTVLPTVSPTQGVTPSITISPTPTNPITPTLTVMPTNTITPTPTDNPPFVFPSFQIVCTPKVTTYTIFGYTYKIEFPVCKVVRTN